MAEATIVDLMRHGEPVGGRRYRGQIDDPLSEKGWQHMYRIGVDTACLIRIKANAERHPTLVFHRREQT